MPLFLTRGKSQSPTVAICDRCRAKFFLTDLKRDRNSPGLRVCDSCNDEKDPYKLPQRTPENISVKDPRVEEQLIVQEE